MGACEWTCLVILFDNKRKRPIPWGGNQISSLFRRYCCWECGVFHGQGNGSDGVLRWCIICLPINQEKNISRRDSVFVQYSMWLVCPWFKMELFVEDSIEWLPYKNSKGFGNLGGEKKYSCMNLFMLLLYNYGCIKVSPCLCFQGFCGHFTQWTLSTVQLYITV